MEQENETQSASLPSRGRFRGGFRISPLNFATAFFLIAAVYTGIYGVSVVGGNYPHSVSSTVFILLFVLFAIVVSFMDLILRNFFRETKKLWIVELSFITLAIIIFLLVK